MILSKNTLIHLPRSLKCVIPYIYIHSVKYHIFIAAQTNPLKCSLWIKKISHKEHTWTKLTFAHLRKKNVKKTKILRSPNLHAIPAKRNLHRIYLFVNSFVHPRHTHTLIQTYHIHMEIPYINRQFLLKIFLSLCDFFRTTCSLLSGITNGRVCNPSCEIVSILCMRSCVSLLRVRGNLNCIG